ncbi:MAG: DUF402 domain-containing protein [Acidobacteriota bacterium]|nr:DUF402 domain-containing protein [Acidobacteriota bacterium]
MGKIQEQKRHVNKPDEYYFCDEVHREPGYLVLRYDVTRAGHIGPFEIPAGSVTIAHYRENTSYVLWEMWGPDRELIGYCYHICLPPEIGKDHVEYLDLLLDLWFGPDGKLTVLDEDEFLQAAIHGDISKEQAELVDCQRKAIEKDHAQIIAGLWRPEQI